MAVVVMTTRNETLNALTYWPSTPREGEMDEKIKEIEEIDKMLIEEEIFSVLLSECKKLQDHANKLGEIITNQTMKRLELEARVKELEKGIEEIPLYEYGEALGDGCDTSGAWSCFCEALKKHFAKVLVEKEKR